MNHSPEPPDPREQTIFDAALQIIDAPARAAYLNSVCADNALLRQRVENLLAASQRADEFLAQNPLHTFAPPPSETQAQSEAEGPGTTIGNYKLLEKLGEGGFGVVYMAEQKQPIKRRVALKIIKIGMDTREVVARFEAERQVLALMDHPNIAKVFDAGMTESPPPASGHSLQPDGRGAGAEGILRAGRPYFVMELVRGIKITDYCDEKNLSTHDRLDLFSQVCHAVQHAHQKGIIHRDLKPSNILVTINDGSAVPKIIDFGIAKATQMELTEKTVFTRFHQFLGTPVYMSPEQTELTSVDIDTRSDIYSLGVLLYELLTGQTPFDTKELLKAGLDEMRRTIREKEPQRPSTRLSTLRGDELTTTAKRRGLDAPKLISTLRGDLDWIVMKCLEKDRNRRYETANGLASDIHRHLKNEPVVACPPSNLYRFQKLIRRNKVAFVAGAAIAAALVIGLAIASWQSIEKTRAYHRAVAAEREAEDNEMKARQIAQFFEEMLAGAGPEVAKGRDATILKEILNQTAQRIGTDLASQPGVEAYLRERIAIVHRDLADYPAAEKMQRRAVELRRQLHPDGHRDLAKALNDLAITVMLQGRLPEAESLARESLEMGTKFPSPDHPAARAAWLNNLATILRREGKSADAEPLYREALDLNKKVLGNQHREVAVTLGNLAIVLSVQNKLAEAEAALREAIAICEKLFGSENPLIAQFLTTLTEVLKRQNKLQQAETVGHEAVAMQRKLLGEAHPNVAKAMANLALVLDREGNLSEAESLHRQALDIRRKALGNDHAAVANSLYELGVLLTKHGQLSEAETMLRECLQVTKKLPPNEAVDLEQVYFQLVKVLNAEGKADEAQKFFDEAQSFRKDLKK